MTPRTLIISGSPRPTGDSASLIKMLTDRLHGEYRIINAYKEKISPCMDCRYCRSNHGCAINDGMGEILDYLADCDNLVIVSPVYYSMLTGKLLDLFSRLQTWYSASAFRGEQLSVKPKHGGLILTAGGRDSCSHALAVGDILLSAAGVVYKSCPAVVARNTDKLSANENMQAINEVVRLSAYLNREEEK